MTFEQKISQEIKRIYRKICSLWAAVETLQTDVSTITADVTNLKNNELKITYYEIVSGASGSITLPTGATFNSDEFGNSGNSILSRINGANKPTYESPKTAGGVVVTANLNTTSGAWVASGVYTDTSVALIYSINIKEVDYANLNIFNIIDYAEVNNFIGLVEEIPFLDSNTGISAQTYTLILTAYYPCTIDEISAICDAGSATVSLEINGTPITGASLTVTSSLNSATATSGNTLNIGDKLSMTVSAPSAFDILQATVKTTRL